MSVSTQVRPREVQDKVDVLRCDKCGAEAECTLGSPAPGWYVLFHQAEHFYYEQKGQRMPNALGHFCSGRCLAAAAAGL